MFVRSANLPGYLGCMLFGLFVWLSRLPRQLLAAFALWMGLGYYRCPSKPTCLCSWLECGLSGFRLAYRFSIDAVLRLRLFVSWPRFFSCRLWFMLRKSGLLFISPIFAWPSFFSLHCFVSAFLTFSFVLLPCKVLYLFYYILRLCGDCCFWCSQALVCLVR